MHSETERCEEELMRGCRWRQAMMQGDAIHVELPN